MSDRLTVWFDGTFVGNLDQSDDGTLRFRYHDGYRSEPGATSLSVSMPLFDESHGDGSSVGRQFKDGMAGLAGRLKPS